MAAALVGAWLVGTARGEPNTKETLQEAIREYQEAFESTDRERRLAKFRRAEILFARLTENARGAGFAFESADLYVNLGNAALGAERLGQAVLAYRRALTLDPDHHRAEQNLRHARTLLPAWVPRPPEGGLFDTFFAWRQTLSVGELQLAAAVAFLLSTVLFAAAIRWRQTATRNLALIPLAIWAFLMALLAIEYLGSERPAAVITVPEVVARSADSAGSPARLAQPIPAGTEVEVVETRDRWAQIRLYDGRDAWLPETALLYVAVRSGSQAGD